MSEEIRILHGQRRPATEPRGFRSRQLQLHIKQKEDAAAADRNEVDSRSKAKIAYSCKSIDEFTAPIRELRSKQLATSQRNRRFQRHNNSNFDEGEEHDRGDAAANDMQWSSTTMTMSNRSTPRTPRRGVVGSSQSARGSNHRAHLVDLLPSLRTNSSGGSNQLNVVVEGTPVPSTAETTASSAMMMAGRGSQQHRSLSPPTLTNSDWARLKYHDIPSGQRRHVLKIVLEGLAIEAKELARGADRSSPSLRVTPSLPSQSPRDTPSSSRPTPPQTPPSVSAARMGSSDSTVDTSPQATQKRLRSQVSRLYAEMLSSFETAIAAISGKNDSKILQDFPRVAPDFATASTPPDNHDHDHHHRGLNHFALAFDDSAKNQNRADQQKDRHLSALRDENRFLTMQLEDMRTAHGQLQNELSRSYEQYHKLQSRYVAELVESKAQRVATGGVHSTGAIGATRNNGGITGSGEQQTSQPVVVDDP